MTGITTPVPSDADYTAPETAQSRIADKWRRMPTVDQNGRTVASTADTGVTQVTGTTPGSAPSMVDALLDAAASVGADPAALVDSKQFMMEVGAISPADTAGLVGAIQDAVAANPSLALQPVAPGMKPNPAQGGSSAGWTPTPMTAADRIRAEAGKAVDQPLPPGSTRT